MEGRNAEQEEGSLKGEVNPTAALFKRQVRTLQEAGKEIEKMLQREEEFPELSDMFNHASSTSVDYVTDLRPHFRLLKMVPLPETLHQMYKSLECKCFLGLFPEINRAWITVDNQLCLWNYESKEYAIWNDQDQIIVSVGLVPPRPNVFSEDVKYVLVLATPVEIVLLAVWFEGNTMQGELHLEPTHITFPADNVNMVKIVGTKRGRIFMGGDDGCLYELHYQADEGWFGQKTRKINHSQNFFSSFASYVRRGNPPALIDVVVDESRNMLYTLSSRGTIEAIYLGENGTTKSHVATVHNAIAQAETLCPRLKPSHAGKEVTVKSIAVIPSSESKHVHLVATTSNAIRLYFTTSSFTSSDQVAQTQRHTTLNLVHVRLPPDLSHVFTKALEASGPATPMRPAVYEASPRTPLVGRTPYAVDTYTPGGGVRRPPPSQPYNIETAYYSQGVALFSQSVGENRDDILAIHQTLDKPSAQAGDIIIPRPLFLEKVTKTDVAGKVWAIDEKPPSVFLSERLRLIPTPAPSLTEEERGQELSLWCDETGQYPSLRNDLAVQHALPARHFLFLTNNALHTMVKLRPLDFLFRVLSESSGHHTEAIQVLEISYGSVEMCVMYLILATSAKQRSYWTLGVPVDSSVADSASRMFFSHPEQPQIITPLQPSYPNTGAMMMGQLIESEPQIKYSGRHDGLALFLTRLLKPLWNRPVQHIGRINQLELEDLQSMLLALQQFLEEHPSFAPIPADLRVESRRKGVGRTDRDDRMDEEEAIPGETAYSRTGQRSIQGRLSSLFHGKPDEGARKQEQLSLSALHLLLRRSIELISFLHILGENKFLGVLQFLPQASQDLLQRMRFSDLVTTPEGFELTRELVDALISPYKEGKGDQASVEAICQRLRASCPVIFREEDRTRHKADELLYKAKLSRNPREREELLGQSLDLFAAVAADLDVDKLAHVCENFLYLRFYSGVLRLALECARAVDSHNLGLEWYKEHKPRLGEETTLPDDESLGARAYEARLVRYQHVLGGFAELFLAQAPMFYHIPFEELERRPADDAETVARKRAILLQEAILSDDQLFHEVLYRWFISRAHPVDLSSMLLEACIQLDSAFIEPFLVDTQSELLPNYYIRKGQFQKAAKVCQEMAFGTEGLDLEQRIDYLSKAKSAAQSAAGHGDLLSTVKDHLDIAQVQSKALQELEALPVARALAPDERERRLKGREELRVEGLKDISTLFNHYIRPFGLWESGLHALKVAHYADEALTKRFWKSIINEELYKMQTTGLNLESLRGKIVSLGQALEREENVFPAEWICGYLEAKMGSDLRQYTGNDYGWVPRVMKEVGFSVPVLFEIYHNALYEENNPDWAEFVSRVGKAKAKLEALRVQHWIVTEWMQDLNSARDTQRRLLIAAAQSSGLEDRLAEYVQHLQQSHRSEEAHKLAQSFRDLHALLLRLTHRM